MSERLVVEKSHLQLGIEAGLRIILPPLIGGMLWRTNGASALNSLAVAAAFFLVSPLGNLIASFGPGERITPDERMRRALARAAGMTFVALAGWAWITYSTLFLSALFAACTPEMAHKMSVSVPALLVLTLACAVLAALQLRRWHRRYDPAKPAERYESVGQWLQEFLPIQFVCVGSGLAAGFAAAHFVPAHDVFLALGGGWLAGIALEAVVADRLLRRKPLLWSQVGFGGALVIAMLRMGLMFGAFFALFGLLQSAELRDPSDKFFVAFFATAIAVGGFIVGTLLMLLMWALARLGDLRARKSPTKDKP